MMLNRGADCSARQCVVAQLMADDRANSRASQRAMVLRNRPWS